VSHFSDEVILNVVATQFTSIEVSIRDRIASWVLCDNRLDALLLHLHQSHPTQEHLNQSLAFLNLGTDSFPASMFKKQITEQEFKVIRESSLKEQEHAIVFVFSLLHFADKARRGLSSECQSGACRHSWHALRFRSDDTLQEVLSQCFDE
jgi:hypothetical protein